MRVEKQVIIGLQSRIARRDSTAPPIFTARSIEWRLDEWAVPAILTVSPRWPLLTKSSRGRVWIKYREPRLCHPVMSPLVDTARRAHFRAPEGLTRQQRLRPRQMLERTACI
jgi:hypothetical protein